LKAQPKSEIATPVKRRSIPLISRDGSVRPHESRRACAAARDVEPDSTAATSLGCPRAVLEVAVHRHDDLAARRDEARVHRRVLAEVALQRTPRHARVGRVQPLDASNDPSVEPSSTKISS
jgi:hypothetical protein